MSVGARAGCAGAGILSINTESMSSSLSMRESTDFDFESELGLALLVLSTSRFGLALPTHLLSEDLTFVLDDLVFSCTLGFALLLILHLGVPTAMPELGFALLVRGETPGTVGIMGLAACGLVPVPVIAGSDGDLLVPGRHRAEDGISKMILESQDLSILEQNLFQSVRNFSTSEFRQKTLPETKDCKNINRFLQLKDFVYHTM